jgi:hypothetical protein
MSAPVAPSFKDEYRVNDEVKSTPEVMRVRPALNSSAPALTGDEFKAAVSALYNKSFMDLKFPRAQRFRVDPPISQQNYYCLHSFTPSPGAQADKDGCFGVVKFRGAFGTMEEADAHAEHLIRSVDSLHEIHIGYVGKEFPLTLDPLYFNETHEIDMKKKMDDVARSHAKTVRDKEQDDMESLKRRERELMDSTKKTAEEIKNEIDHYIALKVKCANILHVRDETMKKLEAFENTRLETMKEVHDLESAHPEFKDTYMEKFLKGLSEVGIKDTPLLKYM